MPKVFCERLSTASVSKVIFARLCFPKGVIIFQHVKPTCQFLSVRVVTLFLNRQLLQLINISASSSLALCYHLAGFVLDYITLTKVIFSRKQTQTQLNRRPRVRVHTGNENYTNLLRSTRLDNTPLTSFLHVN